MKTIKARIAVAVDSTGSWNACGWSTEENKQRYESDVMGLACEAVADGEARYWVEVELPIPEVTTLNGVVSNG